jgi:hypothetical protein
LFPDFSVNIVLFYLGSLSEKIALYPLIVSITNAFLSTALDIMKFMPKVFLVAFQYLIA